MDNEAVARQGYSDEERQALFLRDMQASGLTPEQLAVNGVEIFKGPPEELARILNIELSFANLLCLNCIVILLPYPEHSKKDQAFYRVKLIPAYTPPKGRPFKYLQPKGISTRPYIVDRVWDLRKDPSVDIFIVEGEKKALLLIQEGFHAIALPGVHSFRNSSEADAEHVDLEAGLKAFTWTGRNVYIAFDADFKTNLQVRQAMFELAFRLERHGAIVKIVTWAPEDGKGIDDYIVGKGVCHE